MIVSESLEFITNVNHIIPRLVSFKNNRPKTSFGKKSKLVVKTDYELKKIIRR